MTSCIPALNIQSHATGSLLLTQNNGVNNSSVIIHHAHIRYMAEKLGLVQSTDAQNSETIATLTRRMLVLRDRIDRLHNYLVNHSDHRHADLSYEVTYATATVDIAEEFCEGLWESYCADKRPAA